jgi:hypothetical protein
MLQQPDNLRPHNLVEEILTNWAVIAYRTAKMPPGVDIV